MNADEISAPEKLSAGHELAAFDSGGPVLDQWLRRRPLPNQATGASRTYVVYAGKRVAGYYTLAAGAIAHTEAPGRVSRRLAVDKVFQGRGYRYGVAA